MKPKTLFQNPILASAGCTAVILRRSDSSYSPYTPSSSLLACRPFARPRACGAGYETASTTWPLLAAFLLLTGARGSAEDNTLSEAEKKDGWILLFDGKTHKGWKTSGLKESKTPVEDGCINPHGCGDYMMIYEKPLSNFILSLDFKISPNCNSGIFVRTSSLTPLPKRDVGYNGLEIAVDDTPANGYTDTGAVYDLSKPSKNAMRLGSKGERHGQWNHIEIRCDGSRITVKLNGEPVNDVDLSKFTTPNRRPDGTAHKFDIAYKDHPLVGYIGLQDHGQPCWYKNIKLKPLADGPDASKAGAAATSASKSGASAAK